MSVAFDAVGPGAGGTNGQIITSLSWTHTPVGTPTGVAVTSTFFTSTTVTATYGGISMGAAAVSKENIPNTLFAQIYGLASPLSGAQTAKLTFGATVDVSAGSVTVTGGDTTTCFDHISAGATGTGAAVTDSACTSAAGELVISCAGANGAGFFSGVGAGQTQTWVNNTNTDAFGICGRAAGAPSVTMSATISVSTDPWAIVSASFKAGGGAGFAAVNRRTLGPRVGARSVY